MVVTNSLKKFRLGHWCTTNFIHYFLLHYFVLDYPNIGSSKKKKNVQKSRNSDISLHQRLVHLISFIQCLCRFVDFRMIKIVAKRKLLSRFRFDRMGYFGSCSSSHNKSSRTFSGRGTSNRNGLST